MLTEAKTNIFPGVHGQAAICNYQIALSQDIVRPKVYILLSHEDDYTGTLVVNNEFSCDHAINKILCDDLKGIRLNEVEIYYKCIQDFGPLQIHEIPIKLKWEPKLNWWHQFRLKFGQNLVFYAGQKLSLWRRIISKLGHKIGYKIVFYAPPEFGICGNCPIETDVNSPTSTENKEIVEQLFKLQDKKQPFKPQVVKEANL